MITASMLVRLILEGVVMGLISYFVVITLLRRKI